MTDESPIPRRQNRREFLAGVAAAGLAVGASTTASAASGGDRYLEYTPVNFAVYVGQYDDPWRFGYPALPLLTGYDDQSDNGYIDGPTTELLFDAREVKVVDGGEGLDHYLKFRQDEKIVGEAVDNTYDHVGDGEYLATNDVVEFELDRPRYPLLVLGGGKYRSLMTNVIKLHQDGPREGEFKWDYTRVDFYDRHDRDYVRSMVYAIWDATTDEDGNDRTIPSEGLVAGADNVIFGGRLPYEPEPGEGYDPSENYDPWSHWRDRDYDHVLE